MVILFTYTILLHTLHTGNYNFIFQESKRNLCENKKGKRLPSYAPQKSCSGEK